MSAEPRIPWPASVPPGPFVPHGYLDNPWHSSVLNRSGVIRSAPPLGFGFWCRSMPWPYGTGTLRTVNYLSILHPSVVIDGDAFHDTADFDRAGANLRSGYHTKNALRYDFEHKGVAVSLTWFLADEHNLLCVFEAVNASAEPRRIGLHASHIYGYPETRWWGSDGVASRRGEHGASVSKIWAYGDVFAMRMGSPNPAYKATASEGEWRGWIRGDDQGSNDGAASKMPDPVYSVLSTGFTLAPGGSHRETLSLTRGVNEVWTIEASDAARAAGRGLLTDRLTDDERFYRDAPLLSGDWPDDWRCGWVYDLETIRMNVRPPVGIYRHHWDAMQIFTPRAVLGESVLDAMCLSYADMALAKDVILGTFADAPMPNVPCSREDGSMNMVSMGGEECGTAPIWVLPFRTIRAIHQRDGDDDWLAALYPHMEAFVQWWLDNRTDETGRFFCNNSWESGQDGSKRFLIEHGEEGKESEYVQTVDVEAAMADAMATLAALAPAAGRPERAEHWRALAERRVEATRAMFVDGWFRDFDERNGKPIILPDYLDVMMLLPLSVGIATPEQAEALRPKFECFLRNPNHWLEWPSFLFCFTEAGANAGLGAMVSNLVGSIADRVYARTNSPHTVPIPPNRNTMPEPYRYRIPGTSNEFWPVDPATLADSGSEAYGWGATLPTLILRNIIGFREEAGGFTLAPTLPETLTAPGATYTVSNLRYRGCAFHLTLATRPDGELRVTLVREPGSDPFRLTGPNGEEHCPDTPFHVPNGTTLRARLK